MCQPPHPRVSVEGIHTAFCFRPMTGPSYYDYAVPGVDGRKLLMPDGPAELTDAPADMSATTAETPPEAPSRHELSRRWALRLGAAGTAAVAVGDSSRVVTLVIPLSSHSDEISKCPTIFGGRPTGRRSL